MAQLALSIGGSVAGAFIGNLILPGIGGAIGSAIGGAAGSSAGGCLVNLPRDGAAPTCVALRRPADVDP